MQNETQTKKEDINLDKLSTLELTKMNKGKEVDMDSLKNFGDFFYKKSLKNFEKEIDLQVLYNQNREYKDYEKSLLCFYTLKKSKFKFTDDTQKQIDHLLQMQMYIYDKRPNLVSSHMKWWPDLFLCALCFQNSPIEKSHIISEFLHQLSSTVPHFQKGENYGQSPNDRLLCLPLLCSQCEGSFSHYENEMKIILKNGDVLEEFR